MRLIDAELSQKIADAELNLEDAGKVQHVLSHTPTINPEDLRKKGKPIKYHVPQGESIRIGLARFRAGTTVYRCPFCKTFIRPWQKFCDECGAKMEG